jgi:hypothetical protein
LTGNFFGTFIGRAISLAGKVASRSAIWISHSNERGYRGLFLWTFRDLRFEIWCQLDWSTNWISPLSMRGHDIQITPVRSLDHNYTKMCLSPKANFLSRPPWFLAFWPGALHTSKPPVVMGWVRIHILERTP